MSLIKVVGPDLVLSLPSGRSARYVNLDNAATTPPACEVDASVRDFLNIYGSVQRGAGVKSLISTALFEGAVKAIKDFAGGGENDIVVLSSNTTTAINRLAMSYGFSQSDIVLVSDMEHSSNDLPWRKYVTVERLESTQNGRLDLDKLQSCLENHQGKIRLVALTAASNVTGYLPPVRKAARIAHQYGAEVFVDCAQFAAHQRIRMRGCQPEEDFDYVAFSGHKMYAPYGVGAVVGNAKAFSNSPPDIPGGGTIEMLGDHGVIWAPLPARITPGTPNVLGVIALAAATRLIMHVEPAAREHENALLEYGLSLFSSIEGVHLSGDVSPDDKQEERLPIFSFTVDGLHHALVAAAFSCEYGIGVRAGHLCQYEFMRRALQVTSSEQARQEELILAGNKTSMYGMVRASCGLCTSVDDLHILGEALKELVSRGPQLDYSQDFGSGQFSPTNDKLFWHSLVPKSLSWLLS